MSTLIEILVAFQVVVLIHCIAFTACDIWMRDRRLRASRWIVAVLNTKMVRMSGSEVTR